MDLKTIKDINLKGKRILLRVDYNVTLKSDCQVADDFRLRQTLPTIDYLLTQNCQILLLSHLGRPHGERVKLYSLKPVAKRLASVLKRKVNFFADDYTTLAAREELKKIKPSLVLLENVRFYPGEEANHKAFARSLALLADIFVNDAFGVCHRKHASIVGVPKFLPSAAGLLLEKEASFISEAINHAKEPLVAIVGGAKVEDKLAMIGKLIDKAGYCLLGGKLANAFLKVANLSLGKHHSKIGRLYLTEPTEKLIRQLFLKAAESETALVLPQDVLTGDGQALDIGFWTRRRYSRIIKKAKTIVWVGPMGVYERKKFAKGTGAVYKAICQNRKSLSIVGGGDTLAALKHKHYLKTIDHVSTGGGALLEFIEKGTLPGIEVLEKKV